MLRLVLRIAAPRPAATTGWLRRSRPAAIKLPRGYLVQVALCG
jgi:hypothetical protein